MDVKISELLTAAAPEKLPCPAECDSAALREAVMGKIKEEGMTPKKTGRRLRLRRTLIIAAVIAAALALGALAYGSTFRDLYYRTEDKSPYRAVPRDVITVLPEDSPEYMAYRELDEYRREVQSGLPTGGLTEEEFAVVIEANEKIEQKYLELAEEYGLTPVKSERVDSAAELGASIHDSYLLPQDDPRAVMIYSTLSNVGSISHNGGFTLPGGGVADYGLSTATKGAFESIGAAVYLDELDEWTYTTGEGYDLLLAIGERKSLLYAELEHCYVLAVIRAGSAGPDSEIITSEFDWNKGTHTAVTRSDIEYLAEQIHFSGIDMLAAGGQE